MVLKAPWCVLSRNLKRIIPSNNNNNSNINNIFPLSCTRCNSEYLIRTTWGKWYNCSHFTIGDYKATQKQLSKTTQWTHVVVRTCMVLVQSPCPRLQCTLFPMPGILWNSTMSEASGHHWTWSRWRLIFKKVPANVSEEGSWHSAWLGSSYTLDLTYPSRTHRLRSWSPLQQCSEVGIWGSDRIMRINFISGWSIDGSINCMGHWRRIKTQEMEPSRKQ